MKDSTSTILSDYIPCMRGDAEDWWNRALEEKNVAQTCRAAGHTNQCYHHGGQAIEFALKAIFLRRKNYDKMPDECRGAKWHSLTVLRENCMIDTEYGGMKTDHTLYSNWLTVKDWDSNARFPGTNMKAKDVAQFMIAAFNPKKGIFGWLEKIFQNS